MLRRTLKLVSWSLTSLFSTNMAVSETRTLKCLLHNLNVVVAVSKGMQSVKLCSNKILQFLTGGAG